MKSDQINLENTDTAKEKSACCSQCGWPGIGNMPAGVQLTRQDEKRVMIGQLSYYRIGAGLCYVCQAMQSAVAGRAWFVEAHRDFLKQIEVKNRLMQGR